ncbi:MAG: DUF3592 domain-containing protein [Anaerolineales bacterium]|nr:DUF3592 domain-containing protein [Anaerolineales bacterium]
MQVGNEPFQQGNVNKSPRKLGCAFILLPISAVILLGLGIWYGYTSYGFYSNGIEVEGTVVRLATSHSADSGTTYSPVFSYTIDGQQYEYESVNSSDPPTNQVGDVETLLVDPTKPDKARQNSFMELWFLPCIMFPISFVMIILSIGIPFFVRRM